MSKCKKHITFDGKSNDNLSVHEMIALFITEYFQSENSSVNIAVGGPGGTGKSTFSKQLACELPCSGIVRLDDYKTSRKERAGRNIYGAHPLANKMDLILQHLKDLKENRLINKPVYNAISGRADKEERYLPKKFNILDGEISTYADFTEYIDLAIFIDSDWKTQLNTRITRDITIRGYSKEKAIETFLNSNLREFAKYGAKSKSWADIHIYCDSEYTLKIKAISDDLYESFENCLCLPINSVCP